MKERTFTDNQLSLSVAPCVGGIRKVAVWDALNEMNTMHIEPAEARRMARALLKAADRAEKP